MTERLESAGEPTQGGEEPALEERTSPAPYAEDFDGWVADETAAADREDDDPAAEIRRRASPPQSA